MGQTD